MSGLTGAAQEHAGLNLKLASYCGSHTSRVLAWDRHLRWGARCEPGFLEAGAGLTHVECSLPPCSYLQRRRDRQGAFFTYEVIIVDDGSKDGTVK